jgi:radical SAM superfamily enzyme YgiQ (UPF0313 family)
MAVMVQIKRRRMGRNRPLKIKLVLPQYFNQEKGQQHKPFMIFPNIVLPTLAAITPAPHVVTICDENVDRIDFDEELDLVAITTYTRNVQRGYHIADEFRKRGVPVVMGGIHVSFMVQEALQHCDAVVSGEGEALWPQILEDVQQDDLKPVYQGGQSQDLNDLPVPRWDLLKLDRYFKPVPSLKMPIMSIQTSRGCPHKCDFCTVPVFAGSKMRYRDPEHLLREIDAYGAEFFSIADDNLIVNPDAAADLFKTLGRRNIGWFGFFDTQTIRRPELVELAAKAGCRRAFLGIESIHPNELATVNKKFNRPEKYEDLIKLFHKNGIAVDVGILFGFEDENLESTIQTVEELKRCNVETAIFSVMTPFPGTALFNRTRDKLIHTDWDRYTGEEVVWARENTDPEETRRLLQFAFERFYSYQSIFKRVASPNSHAQRKLLALFSNLRFRNIIKYRFPEPLPQDFTRRRLAHALS